MPKKLSVYFIFSLLIVIGGWGILKIVMSDEDQATLSADTDTSTKTVSPTTRSTFTEVSNSKTSNKPINKAVTPFNSDAFRQTNALLSAGQTQAALALIEQNQINLSSTQLDTLKTTFFSYIRTLTSSDKLSRAAQDLALFSQTFDELTVWDKLVETHATLNNSTPEFEALLRAAELENRSDVLQDKIKRLESLSASIKQNLNNNNDLLAVRELYQKLYNQFSNSARFAYELALSHMALGDTSTAEQLLLPLKFDLELGNIATQQLQKIEAQNQRQIADRQAEPEPEFARNDLVVPLTRRGNSFLVDTSVNGRDVRLLLDTGASITSFSSQQIQRLGLTPTGQSVSLSTANGTRRASLYRVDKIRLGRLTIKGLIVAEIEFNANSPIQGLLGTDLLNRVNQRYNYLIDNNANALIFRPKRR